MSKALLLEVAGFLNILAQGLVPVPAHVRKEAAELLGKIGLEISKDGRK